MDENRELERREFRRQRRIRNQIMAYVAVAVIAILLIVGIAMVVAYVSKVTGEKKQAAELQAQLESLEQQEQQVTLSEPESMPETETEPETVVEERDLLDEAVDACIAEMPLEDKVAGLFYITPEALADVDVAVKAGNGTKKALGEYAVGGLIYFSQNIESEEQLTEMISNTQMYSKYPLFIGVDEEGGDIARVANSSIDAENVGPMADIGAAGDTQKAYTAGATMADYLSALGFNMNFAPVADVLTDPNNETIGNRSFSDNGAVVAAMVPSAVQGLEENGVSACLKHFPGLGGTTEDTHVGMATSNRTLEEFRNVEFNVFKAGVEAGADFVMVGHVSVPSITGDNTPASVSPQVIGLLRDEIGFEGVIITDAMNMGAITEYYTSDEAAIKAIQAGADMILMPEDFKTAYNGLLQAVKDGTISEERINESLHRIYRIKYADKVEQ